MSGFAQRVAHWSAVQKRLRSPALRKTGQKDRERGEWEREGATRLYNDSYWIFVHRFGASVKTKSVRWNFATDRILAHRPSFYASKTLKGRLFRLEIVSELRTSSPSFPGLGCSVLLNSTRYHRPLGQLIRSDHSPELLLNLKNSNLVSTNLSLSLSSLQDVSSFDAVESRSRYPFFAFPLALFQIMER